MTILQQATADQVQVARKFVSGGELACTTAPGRAPSYRYQGRKIDAATAARLGW